MLDDAWKKELKIQQKWQLGKVSTYMLMTFHRQHEGISLMQVSNMPLKSLNNIGWKMF